MRQTEKIFQQSRVIAAIQSRLEAFDNEIVDLQKARLDVDIKSKFLEAHFLSLYQELWILKDFEDIETELLKRIAIELMKCEDIKLEYLSEKTHADGRLANIKDAREELQAIQGRFQSNGGIIVSILQT